MFYWIKIFDHVLILLGLSRHTNINIKIKLRGYGLEEKLEGYGLKKKRS